MQAHQWKQCLYFQHWKHWEKEQSVDNTYEALDAFRNTQYNLQDTV